MSWQLRHFSYDTYGTSHSASIPCVLLSGWSANSDIFDWLMPGLAQYFQVYSADIGDLPESLEQAAEELAQSLHFEQPALIIAWSLGGNIAIELAHRYPEKVKTLCLLASSPCFVAKADWPWGMEQAVFSRFQQELNKDHNKVLRRFDALQVQGDSEAESLNKALKDYRQQSRAWSKQNLSRGLSYLASCDQRALLAQLKSTQLWCFGEKDALVSFKTAKAVQKLAPNATIIPIRESAHLPFLKRPDQVFQALLSLSINSVAENKQKIAASFGAAAQSYDQAAFIQQWAAERLLNKVPLHSTTAKVLDIGCGTGKHSAALAEKAANMTGLDLADGMVRYAKEQYPHLRFITADAEHLPYEDNSVDGIFSNLTVQWSQQPIALFEEWFRVLKPGGKVWFSTLTDKSLIELRNSFAKADNEPHVNVFPQLEQWRHYVEHAGFMIDEQEQIKRIDYYDTLTALLRSLKNIGAQTVLYRKTAKPMNKKRWQLLQSTYERTRHPQGLPLSYQLAFFTLSKAE